MEEEVTFTVDGESTITATGRRRGNRDGNGNSRCYDGWTRRASLTVIISV